MIWLDAHLSPRLAKFITQQLGRDAIAVRDLNLHHASDADVYSAAAAEKVVVVTKDKDFAELSSRLGPPPHVILLTCGNTTEKRMQELFRNHLEQAMKLIEGSGEPLVEITDNI